jgi:hypothetical protein
LRGLSQGVQLYTGAQINFGDPTPDLTYGYRPWEAVCCLGSAVGGTTGPRMTYKDRRRSAKLDSVPFQNRRRKSKPRQKNETLSDKNPRNPVRRGDLFNPCEGNPVREVNHSRNETLQVLECSDILCKFFKYQNLRNLKTIFPISHFVMLKESNKPFIMTLPFLGRAYCTYFLKPRELEI